MTMTIKRYPMDAAQVTRIRGWIAIPLALAVSLASAAPAAAPFDAARLRTGTFMYSDTVKGQTPELSTSTVSRLSDGTYRFAAAFPAFDESWNTVATRTLAPVATQLKMRTRTGQHYTLTLSYSGSKVSGKAVLDPATDGSLPGSDQPVTGRITQHTVDQRIDWAAVMGTDKRPGETFDFDVYDAKTAISHVHCQVRDAGLMDTPEGKVHAIRINYIVHKATGTETYAVYTTAAYPRMMLREELRGNLVITLVRIGSTEKRTPR